LRRKEGLQRRRHLFAAGAGPRRRGLRQRRVRRRRPLPAGRFRQALGGLALPAVGLQFRGAPAGQVPLSSTSSARNWSAGEGGARNGREVLLCGDWNIAHTEKDLKNWKSNQKNSGFLPEERAWLGAVFDELGWVDVHRRLLPEATGEAYTWWSNRGQAWAKNVGWRIDYQIATPGLAATARQAARCTRRSAFPTMRR
jgi:hypothetical protein